MSNPLKRLYPVRFSAGDISAWRPTQADIGNQQQAIANVAAAWGQWQYDIDHGLVPGLKTAPPPARWISPGYLKVMLDIEIGCWKP